MKEYSLALKVVLLLFICTWKVPYSYSQKSNYCDYFIDSVLTNYFADISKSDKLFCILKDSLVFKSSSNFGRNSVLKIDNNSQIPKNRNIKIIKLSSTEMCNSDSIESLCITFEVIERCNPKDNVTLLKGYPSFQIHCSSIKISIKLDGGLEPVPLFIKDF